MKLTSRARHAVRLVLEISRLAEGQEPVQLSRVARVTGMSKAFLEQLAMGLRSHGLVRGVAGRKGGYRLTRPAAEITVGEVISAVVGPLDLTECTEDSSLCMSSEFCECRLVWQLLKVRINNALNAYTIADLQDREWLDSVRERIRLAGEVLSPAEVAFPGRNGNQPADRRRRAGDEKDEEDETMASTRLQSVNFGGRSYRLDDFGFLDPPEQWDKRFAGGMARLLGIHEGLTKHHWDIIYYLRDKFLGEKTVPVVVFACIDNGVRMRQLMSLFPTGYHRGACKIAGINYAFMRERNIWLTYENYVALAQEHAMTDAGFLRDFHTWTRRFAHLVALDWDLAEGLTEQHWGVIRFLREAFERTNRTPTVLETCRENELSLRELMQLFPDGYRRGACRAAGLPFYG